MWISATLRYVDNRGEFLVTSADPEALLDAWETYVYAVVGDAVEKRFAGQDASFETWKSENNVTVTKAQFSVSSKCSN